MDFDQCYGAAHTEDKKDFLIDFVHMLGHNKLPLVIGGDFNIIRRINERSKAKKTPYLVFLL